LNSTLDPAFIKCYAGLPERVRELARAQYRLWKANPDHPGLNFKRLQTPDPLVSVRINEQYRAVGVIYKDRVSWFFIGTHADYNALLRRR